MRRLAVIVAFASLAGCGGGSPPERGASVDTARALAAPPPAAREEPDAPRADSLYAVQLAAFADSVAAVRMRDSLAREGWPVDVGRASAAGAVRWRARVLPTASQALAMHALAAFRSAKRDASLVRLARRASASPAVELWPVNRRSHGMAARVLLARSADGRAMAVVEDPAAVEAEPVPNGIIVASERTGALLQLDGVWDARPSPDWSRLAFSWAYVVQGRDETSIPPERWRALARELPAPLARAIAVDERAVAERLRASSFPASGMSLAAAVGLVQTLRLDTLARGAHVVRREAPPSSPVLRLDGWKVRWTRDGRLAVGAGLRGAQEMWPPLRWVLLGARGDSVGAPKDTANFDRIAWTVGPTIDYGGVHDLPAPAPIVAGTRRIESAGGWIRVRDGSAAPRVIGPGQALAATAAGRFIAALVPSIESRESHPMQLVVYHLDP